MSNADDIVTRLRGKEHGDNDLRCKSCDSFCCHCELCDCCLEILEVCLEAADELEKLRNENKTMANLLWDFMENTDENLSANLSILHRAAKTFAFKRLEMCDPNDPCEMCKVSQ